MKRFAELEKEIFEIKSKYWNEIYSEFKADENLTYYAHLKQNGYIPFVAFWSSSINFALSFALKLVISKSM